jgi:phosphoglycerate kinase
MTTVTAELVKGKQVLLRLDIDVPIENGKVVDDFRLQAGLPTLRLCLENAEQVIILGHIGRPEGREVPELSIAPIHDWLVEQGFGDQITAGKLKLLENLRFERGEEDCSTQYAEELATLGNLYINEAFASYHPAASTTVLPTLLPHAMGLRFSKEVDKLTEIRNNPKKPFVAIVGGAKMEDKVTLINVLAERANAVLVGGKLAKLIHEESFNFPHNVLAGMLTEDGEDIAPHTIDAWKPLLMQAKLIVWNGPVGKFEDPKNIGSKKLAEIIVESEAETVVGGGDVISAIKEAGVLDKISFVSTGGGAMLKFLSDGTLPTIEGLS